MNVTRQLAGRREWIALAVLALPCVVYAMDLTVLNLALPKISADLHPTASAQLWIVDIYGFMVAGALITMGGLGDRIGARRLLLIGAAAFAAASLFAAFAQSAGMLIAARAVLGLAGATVAPATLSLIRALFTDERQRTAAIGVWVTSYSAGAAIGPLVGGALLALGWWGAVFLPALPVMALVLVLGPRLLPEQRDAAAGRLDVPSAALSLAAVLALIFGLKQSVLGGGAWSLVWIAAGLMLAGLFVARQRRLDDPLIDLALFRVPAFSAALTINLLAFFAVFGMALFAAQYLQSVAGLSPLVAGLWSVPEALAFIVGSTLTPRLAERWGAPRVVFGGVLVGAVGYAITALGSGSVQGIVGGMTFGAFGLAAVVTLVTDMAVGAAPEARAAAAAATAETSSELGGALGLAILGALGASVFRGLSGAHDTIGATIASAHGDQATIMGARDAFTDALTVTAVVSVAVLLVAAVIAQRLARGRSAPSARMIADATVG